MHTHHLCTSKKDPTQWEPFFLPSNNPSIRLHLPIRLYSSLILPSLLHPSPKILYLRLLILFPYENNKNSYFMQYNKQDRYPSITQRVTITQNPHHRQLRSRQILHAHAIRLKQLHHCILQHHRRRFRNQATHSENEER